MRITLVCVGRLSREYEAVFEHYRRLLKPYSSLEVIEVPETPIARGPVHVREAEAREILRHLRPQSFTVALDRSGRQFSSEEFSALLAERKLYGRSGFLFILGGALGLDESVRRAADLVWSLSESTFPHQLARCIVVEQLYRAIRIERGEPYHH